MKKMFGKRTVAALLVASWFFQPVLATEPIILTGDTVLTDGISNAVIENYAGNGGALLNNGYNLTVTGGSFSNNLLKKDNGASFGGAIYHTGGVLELSNVSLNSNIVQATEQSYAGWSGVDSPSGGAIYLGGTTGDNIISNSSIVENKALNINNDGQSNGGAIFAQTNNKLTISDSTFTLNEAKSRGGAVYNGDTAINVTNTTFSNNKVTEGSGGAFYLLDVSGTTSVTTDSNTSFKNNTAASYGGAIVNWDGKVISNGSSFTGNEAANGGAIANLYWQNGATVEVNGGSVFSGNNATSAGGAIFNNAKLTLDSTDGDILFTNNTANGQTNDIHMEGDSATSLAQLYIKGDSNKITLDVITGNVYSEIFKQGDNEFILNGDNSGYLGKFVQESGTTTIASGAKFFGGENEILGGNLVFGEGAIIQGINVLKGSGKMTITDLTDMSSLNDSIVLDSDNAVLELLTTENNNKNLDVSFVIESGQNGLGTVLHSGDGALNINNAGGNNLFASFNGSFVQESTGITNIFGKSFNNSAIKAGILNLKDGAELVGITDIGASAKLNIGDLGSADTTVNPVAFTDNSKVTISGNVKGQGSVDVTQGNVTLKRTSDNSKFVGNYHQTNGVVTAEAGSKFFGGTNLIEKGKLIFKKNATLADGKNVELKGNSAVANSDAVLDLDGRNNVVFNGKTLYVDNKTTEGFVFTDGVLQNALIAGSSAVGEDAVVTLSSGSGLSSGADVTLNNAKLIFATGSSAAENSTLNLADASSVLNIASTNIDWHTVVSGIGSINVDKDVRETSAPKITIYGDQSGFTGSYTQEDGTVTVAENTVFFKGNNTNINVNGGNLILNKGSLLSGDININGVGGASDKHGRVWISDKIYDVNGNELTDIDKLMLGDLYYNTKADGSAVDKKHITVANGGLMLSNGTIFDGSQGSTVFDKVSGGVVDIGFSNGSGVNGDIELREDTMLSYGDNAFIKDDSTLAMDGNAILNFVNQETELTYNPTITGGGAIYKEGKAVTNVSSSIDMTGEVNVKEGTLNFTNKDKVSFSKTQPSGGSYGRQTGNLVVGSDSSNAIINIVAKETYFGGDVTVNAQDGTQSGLNLLGQNTTIGGNLNANNTNMHITGNTNIGGDFLIDGNSGLNLVGNSSNILNIASNMELGANLKDGKLPIAFDYNPHAGTMDTLQVGSFVNASNAPLLITGINFVTSPADRVFNLDATRLIQQRNVQDTPYYDPTSFYANTAMGRYYLSNGAAGGSKLTGTLVYLNPQQYRGQVATVAAWQNQLVVNNMLFDHMDIVTRQLMDEQKTANKYAAAYPQFAPYQYDMKGGSLWYKAYGNFETLSMTKGLNVRNNAYGSLIGADFPLIKLKHGWNLVPTAYIGYNGAHQTFDGVSMYQNGAQLGVMGTAYKGDFITSLLAYGGGYANDMSVKGGAFGTGSDTTGNWFAGVASKTAYNVRLPKDFIFQPTFLMSYNAFGNQNWGSNFGVLSMNSGMLNGINIAPGFNFIWQKKTFNIYATAQMVYNIMGCVDGRAGNVDLGNVRMRHSYFEYGLGVSKSFKERFTGFLQFTIRNGGRTGIGFQGGLNFKIGK